MAFEMTQRGHDVEVSTSLPTYESKGLRSGYSFWRGPFRETVRGAKILRFPAIPRGKGLGGLALNYASNLLLGMLNAFRMDSTADVSLCFGVSPVFLATSAILKKRIYGTPMVLWLQDPWPETFAWVIGISENHWLYKFLGHWMKWIYSHCDMIWIQSNAYKKHLERYGYAGPVHYVPNWAPALIEDLNSEPLWVQDLPSDRFLLTFAGNVGKGQALDQLLEALVDWKEKESLAVVIVGDGTELNGLRDFAHAHRLSNVHFVGRKPLEDMAALFQKSSALYVSLSNGPLSSMTVPSKLQTYMLAGKPVLAQLDGEGAEIINAAQCGRVGAPGDVSSLMKNLKELVFLPKDQLKNLGKNAKMHYSQNFAGKVVLDRVEHLLKEVVK